MSYRWSELVLRQGATSRSSALSAISIAHLMLGALTQNVDGALVHDLEQLQQVHGQKPKRCEGDLIVGIMATEQL